MKNKGFTLIEVIISVGIGAIVLVGANSLLIATAQKSRDVKIQVMIDTMQNNGVIWAKSLSSLAAGMQLQAPKNLPLKNCLAQSGVGCQSSAAPVPLVPASLNQFYGVEGVDCSTAKQGSANCNIQRITTYTVNCSSATSCESVSVNIATNYVDPNPVHKGMYQSRSFDFQVPGAALIAKTSLSQACAAANDIVFGFSFQNNLLMCSNFNGVNGLSVGVNTNGVPLLNFANAVASAPADLAKLINQGCLTGFSGVGVLQSQYSCYNAVIAPPACSPLAMAGSACGQVFNCTGGVQDVTPTPAVCPGPGPKGTCNAISLKLADGALMQVNQSQTGDPSQSCGNDMGIQDKCSCQPSTPRCLSGWLVNMHSPGTHGGPFGGLPPANGTACLMPGKLANICWPKKGQPLPSGCPSI